LETVFIIFTTTVTLLPGSPSARAKRKRMPSHTLTPESLQEIYIFALSLARGAGDILLAGVDKRTGDAGGRDEGPLEEKMNAVDIVTQTDLGMFA